ncbi:MAG TPA: exodeoxyribonuclease V subunit gamma, partial [Deltaproteobacteria bacterium]|nr:exodeoxyribonuclease V subunit gamma [Deltaproteobacteria bacterium]
MQGLKLFAGNRLETLVRTLSDHLSEPLASPLAPEVIIVQSKGMEHWLSMQLASRHGVCSNCTFPFPHTVMNRLFRQVLDGLPEASAFEPESMAWRVMAVLPGLLDSPGFETLKSYLADDRTGVKLYQLSSCLADLFDTYLVFRPGMILGWQSGRLSMPGPARSVETWQCALWRAVSEGRGHEHPAALRERFLASLGPAAVPKLPGRLSLFGISSLPPFYLEVFHALSRFIPVSFYLLNPCREYWGDIRSRGEMAGMPLLRRETVQDLHLEEGNGLLASLGAVGRDLFDMLQEYEVCEFDAFEDVEPDTLLKSVQRDILDLVSPGPEDGRVVKEGDRSIQVHSCHSPMREVEVLRDSLLALFDSDPGLRPEDVLVMSPDIELYAPFIQAVFDVPRKDPDFLPFAIVDRSLKTSNSIADVLMAILDMSTSRFEATRVLELLESEPLRRRFGLAEGDITPIERWVRETGIRWGIDASWKRDRGLPDYPGNTWEFGLDRMLLGYAMTSEGGAGFAGVLPYDDIEGDSSLVLGSFLSFLRSLFERVRDFGRARTLHEWSALLEGLLAEFFAVEEEAASQVSGLRALFKGLGDMQDRAGMAQPLGLDVIRAHLKGRIGAVAEGRNFLSGGMTFCAMLPMRSVPFKVVCLLGMNHDAFPRHQRALGFDLIGRQPRRGDCNQRNKDLYLFLEALLSARSVFYASYLGQSMQDNAPIPPSVALSTLLEHVEGAYRDGEGKPVGDRIHTRHCLQAFNPRYFTGAGPLFSYSRENADAARALLQPGRTERAFLGDRLADPGDEWRVVDVGTLCSFFRDPAKFLLEHRLKMAIPGRPPFMEDFEPVEVTDL